MRERVLWLTLALLAAVPGPGGSPAADDDGEEIAAAEAVRLEYDAGTVRLVLPADRLQRLGLAVEPAEAYAYTPERIVLGEAVDASGLLAARAEAAALRAEQAFAERALALDAAHLARLASARTAGVRVDPAATYAAEQARLERERAHARAEERLAVLRAATAYRWGGTLAAAVDDPSPPWLADLTAGAAQLVRLSLGHVDTIPPAISAVPIAASGERARAAPARVLDAAPAAGRWTGPTFWLLAEDPALRLGMQVTGWLPAGEPLAGSRIPKEAAVWHGGRRWIYVRVAETAFERRALREPRDLGAAYFVADGLPPAAPTVVRGAQSLLAEEFRWAIPEEGDD